MKIRYAFIEMLVCLSLICVGCQKTTDISSEATAWSTEMLSTDTEMIHGIYVDVCGAVNVPGVYELSENARVCDAIEAAGGLTEDAAREAVNMARTLSDGEQIFVASKAESSLSDKLNINTATLEELCSLPGLGEAKAQAIIDYRLQHGSFQNLEDLMKVPGIKEGLYQKIREMIRI